jgi:hypothetical protein
MKASIFTDQEQCCLKYFIIELITFAKARVPMSGYKYIYSVTHKTIARQRLGKHS